MPSIDYRQYITYDPQVRNGEPCIRGLPITVFEIIGRLGAGRTFGRILTDYPKGNKASDDLKVDDLHKKAIAAIHSCPDLGTVIATMIDRMKDRPALLQLWAVPKGLLLWSASDPVSSLLAFSSDGHILAAIAPPAMSCYSIQAVAESGTGSD